MKHTQTKHLLSGFAVFALALCSFNVIASAQNDTVNAVGTPAQTAPATTPAKTPTVIPAPIPTADGAVLPPSQTGLSTTGGLTPLPGESAGSVEGTNVMGDSGVAQKHSGTYYDSNAIVPDSELSGAGATGPRKIDPAVEPGQTFVIVNKTAGASSFEAQYVAATRALKLARYAAAMEMFEKLYRKNSRDPRILMGLAVSQQGAGFNESAATTYEELLRIEPNNADAVVNLMGIMKSQYPAVTLQKLMAMRNKFPTSAGVAAQIGLVNADMKQYDEAVRYLEVAASLDPNNPLHIFNLAIVSDRKGDTDKAIKFYERALEMDAVRTDTLKALPREQIYDRLVVLRRKA